MSGLRAAVSFLTRLPVAREDDGDREPAAAARWFPVAGALVGLAVAGAYAAAVQVLPAAVAAAAAVGLGVLLTGALHEDGLADTMDAVAGSFTRDEALQILRDPRHGTFGVVAIALSLVIRIAAVASLGAIGALAALPAAHALSRAGVVVVLTLLPAATEDGMGAAYARRVAGVDAVVATAWAGVVAIGAVGPWAPVAVGAAGIGAALAARPAVRRLGGLTGDVLGAVQQAGEAAVLVLASALSARGWWSAPWWG
jgi:adenosylcobinamide-GDP ribazoletransferase